MLPVFTLLGCNEPIAESSAEPANNGHEVKVDLATDALKKYCIWQVKKNNGDNINDLKVIKESPSFTALQFSTSSGEFHGRCSLSGVNQSREYKEVKL